NNGILERYYLSHISIRKVLLSQIIVHCVTGLIQFFVLLSYLKIFFNLHITSILSLVNLFSCYLAVLLSTLAIGALLGILFKRKEVVLTASLVVMFMMYFFSGCFIDYDLLPESIKEISNWLPLKYLAQDSFDIFTETQLINETLYITSFFIFIIFSFISMLLLKKKYSNLT
ncbi:MAG: ABC transporter permease, partial [Lactovum sp.]